MLKRICTWEFWDLALARAGRTALQGFVAVLSTCTMLGEMNWAALASGTAVAVLMSVATSMIKALPEEGE